MSASSREVARVPARYRLLHLHDSPFLGGPERQLMGLARSLPRGYHSVFLCFPDHLSARPFMERLREEGLEGHLLSQSNPHHLANVREIREWVRRLDATVLFTHGYKADVLGWLATRHSSVPLVSVSRGWTGASARVRLYDRLDRLVLRWADQVVAVSEGQAAKVRRAGVADDRITVIRNAVELERFAVRSRTGRETLLRLFPRRPDLVVASAGRLSPEKGFDVLVEAAAALTDEFPRTGFIVFGEGPERARLEEGIWERGLAERFMLPGFRPDLDAILPAFDVVVLPSRTEGLPNVALEACAAALPVVATAVGGTPEVIADGETGLLVPPDDPAALARRLAVVLRSPTLRHALGRRGHQRVEQEFTFEQQSRRYGRLIRQLERLRLA